MRILHVVPSYLPAVRYGGPIVSVHALCAALARRGHEVHVFTTNVDGSGDSDVPLDRPVMMEGVNVHYFPSSTMRRLYYSPRMAAAIDAQLATFDLVHLHSVFLWPTWAAARVARKTGRPYVISPRGMLVGDLIRSRSRWIKTLWIALIEKKNLRRAAAIHSTSKIETEEMLVLDLKLASRPFEIPNGVNLPELDLRDPESMEAPYVLALGRISWKKRLELTMEAIAKVPELNLVIAGADDDGMEKEKLLQQSLALMITSISENFGNVVLESMAAARPVLCVPQVGAAEIVTAANAGAVVEPDADQLATVLRRWLQDPALAESLGKNGRQWVELQYSWDTIAERMETSYQLILDSQP
jgi:glycosyltransferase involved in cell wall biosynthesis